MVKHAEPSTCTAARLAQSLCGPLTHRAYAAFVALAATERGEVVRPFVQVRRRGAVLCGRVDRLGEHSHAGQWFKVATPVGMVWAESAQVRMCSGDGRCTCEQDVNCQDRNAVRFFQAGVVAPPEGSIFGTRPVRG